MSSPRRKDAKGKDESRRKDEVDRKGNKDFKVKQWETEYCLIVWHKCQQLFL